MAITTEVAGAGTPVAPTQLGGLAAGANWISAAISYGGNLDVEVMVTATTNATTAPTGSPTVAVYAYGSSDGTTFPDAITGAEATTALHNIANVKLIGLVNLRTAVNATDTAGPFSIAAAFNGTIPTRWGLVLVNNTGQPLGAGNGAATNGFTWTGFTVQSV